MKRLSIVLIAMILSGAIAATVIFYIKHKSNVPQVPPLPDISDDTEPSESPDEDNGQPSTPDDKPEYCSVIFYDANGNIIKTENVVSGSDATPPDDPLLSSTYVFTGWDKSFSSVTENREIFPNYVEVSGTRNAICSPAVYAKPGEEFTIDICLSGDVNACCLELEIEFAPAYVKFEKAVACDGAGVINFDEGTQKIYFVMANSENVRATVDLCSLQFIAIGDDVTEDSIRIKVTDIASFDESGNISDETYRLICGKINITKGEKQ